MKIKDLISLKVDFLLGDIQIAYNDKLKIQVVVTALNEAFGVLIINSKNNKMMKAFTMDFPFYYNAQEIAEQSENLPAEMLVANKN
jgi:hypothetical protein